MSNFTHFDDNKKAIMVDVSNKEMTLRTAVTSGKTGVETEALTGVCTALLTIYDMCKALDKGMVISDVHLVSKSGGKSGEYICPNA